MKKLTNITIALLICMSVAAQGFSSFNIEGAYTKTKLKNNAKGNSTIETVIPADLDIKNLTVKYELLGGCVINQTTPLTNDYTQVQTVTIEKNDGTSRVWDLVVHQLKPTDLPIDITFGKQNPCDLEFKNPKVWAGYGIDYRKPTVARFGNSGVHFIVAFNGTAKEVSYTLTNITKNDDPFNGEFDVQVSADGKKWKNLITYTPTKPFVAGEKQTHKLKANVRFVRWVYAVREKQNVNLNNIYIN